MENTTLTRTEAVQLMAAGQTARQAGDPPTACPYSPNGDADTRLRLAAWMRGYSTRTEGLAAAAEGTDDPDPTDDEPANTSTVLVMLPAADDAVTSLAEVDGGAHCTLLWFGEADDTTANDLRAVAAELAAALPFTELVREVASVGRLGDDEPQALVAHLDDATSSPTLAGIREDVFAMDETGRVREAWESIKQWPTFTPHVTVGYPATTEDADQLTAAALEVGEVRFDRLAVWQGDRQDEYQLGAQTAADDQEDDAVTAAAPEADTALRWEGPLVAEGIATGDKRKMQAGAIEWMGTPGVLKAMFSDAPGHDGSVPVGLIETVERREDGRLWATGTWDTGTAAIEARRQNIAGLLRGVSVDLDDVEVHFETEDGTVLEGDEMWEVDTEPILVIDRARLRAATLWAIPAFVEAYVLDSTVADQIPDTSIVTSTSPTGLGLAASAIYTETETRQPAPAAAFAYPGAENLHDADGNPRGFTVTPEGHVFGYAATWGTCHIGIDGACVTPPTSETAYAHFLTRDYTTSDGETLAVGAITLGTGHAPLELRARPAAEHYDHTGTAGAFVNMGEDETGIWFAGALNEDLDDLRRRELSRAGGVSGDWRRIGGNLEMVATLAVNVPGFPIPKVASRVASGVQQTLVASGIVPAHAPAETGIDYRRLAAEVTAYQTRQARKDAASRRVRKVRQASLAGRITRG